MSETIRFRGMGYEQASREAAKIIAKMHETGNWHDAIDDLMFLRGLMRTSTGFLSHAIDEIRARGYEPDTQVCQSMNDNVVLGFTIPGAPRKAYLTASAKEIRMNNHAPLANARIKRAVEVANEPEAV